MKKIALVFVLALGLSACSDEPGARRALENSGFTNIKTTGWSMWGCSGGKGGDQFSTGFNATGLNGNEVEGVVCSGWFKGSTIRLF